jgi:tetratricopeptide (TPR) repeat protein
MSQDDIKRADALLAQKKVAAAVPFLEAAMAGMPEGWRARTETAEEIAIAFWDERDFLAYCAHGKPAKKVVWKLPSYSRVCYYLAFAAVERQDLDAGERWIDEGLVLEPDHPLLLCEKALILGYRKRREESLAFYRKAALAHAWNPAWSALAYRGIGFQLVEGRDLDEAEKAFRRSLELEPSHPVAVNELGVIADLRTGGVKALSSGLTRGGTADEAEKN